MRSVLWIAADLSKEAIARPGLLALASGMIVLVPFQLGLSTGALTRFVIPDGEGVRDFLTASALCPAMSAVFLFGGIAFPRLLSHEMEPLMAAPVTDRQVAIGFVLPFLILAIAGSIPASALTLAGFTLSAGVSPGGGILARWLDLLFAMLAASLWTGCALIRSMRRLTGAGVTAWNVLLACLGLTMIDTVAWHVPLPLVRAGAILAAVPASWWFSRSVDREVLIGPS